MKNKIISLSAYMLIGVLISACDSSPNLPTVEGSISMSLRNQPAPTAEISKIVIYRTDKPGWLDARALYALTPLADLTDRSEIARFFEVVDAGCISTQKQEVAGLAAAQHIIFSRTM
jgi:hypothetical protein